jgi:hypothetical protein
MKNQNILNDFSIFWMFNSSLHHHESTAMHTCYKLLQEWRCIQVLKAVFSHTYSNPLTYMIY